MVYTPHASPLVDALMDGESVDQLMVDSRGDYAIFMLDPNGYVASWNKGAQHVKGYSREEIVGKHFSVFDPAEDRASGKPERELIVAAGAGHFEEEGKRVRKDGSEFWANVKMSSVRDHTDALIAFVKVTRDLTERRAAEARASVIAQALKAANAELESFTYSVSHDLQAPIRQIEGFCKILAEHLGGDIDPQAKQYLRWIEQSSRQMGRLVGDLLQLAHVGRLDAAPRETSLDSLIGGVLTNVRTEITDRKIEWRVGALPKVVCDAGLMKIVLTNLLSNAVKYTRTREKAVIEIGQMVKDGETVVYVRDNGVGFDMRYADKLFGVFQRLHRDEDFEGTGVGLATVHRILRKQNGRIWAEAAPDQGATFFFTCGSSSASDDPMEKPLREE
jgi:PAS domain S-box-containing protein